MTRSRTWFAALIPDLGPISATERLRATLGACLGLLATGFISRAALGPSASVPLLIAPMGALAVLLFAVPSSPLAQPWSILGGNVVAALIGVTAARCIADPLGAAAVGGSLAILGMLMLRCLHPPSGAVALTAVLGGPAVQTAGYGFVIWPVGINSILLLAMALAFNNATGRRYPHGAIGKVTANEAVVRVLRRHDEIVDVGQDDLASLIEDVEAETQRSLARAGRCGDLMRPETDALPASLSLESAFDRMDEAGRMSLPVVDETGRLLGLAAQGNVLRHLRPTRTGRRVARLFRRSLESHAVPREIAAIATPVPVQAEPDTSIGAMLYAMLKAEADYCPVLDEEQRIVGGLTQSDLLRWLVARHSAAGPRFDSGPQPRSTIHRL